MNLWFMVKGSRFKVKYWFMVHGSSESGGQELLYTLSTQYIDLWSSSSLQGIAQASLDSALASFVTSLKNRYLCVM